jgi:hypothetical protein
VVPKNIKINDYKKPKQEDKDPDVWSPPPSPPKSKQRKAKKKPQMNER